MRYLLGLFDARRRSPKPLVMLTYNSDTSDIKFTPLYMPGTGLKIYEVEENLESLRQFIYGGETVVADFKSIIRGLGLNIAKSYKVHDAHHCRIEDVAGDLNAAKKLLLRGLKAMQEQPIAPWQRVLANAQLVYSNMEERGFKFFCEEQHSVYDLTYSGRSKTLVHNIQGYNANDQIWPIDQEHTTFLHFDWIAADIRVASILSEDEDLQAVFDHSDPYSAIAEELSSEGQVITRDDCKKEFFECLYSLNTTSPILELYPKFSKWLNAEVESVNKTGSTKSILGRVFSLGPDRTNKSVFNAKIQGSVAHAMQAAIYKVFRLYPQNVLAEIHDSLVLTCKKEQIEGIVGEVAEVMLHPFRGLVPSDPRFPLKVSVGESWRNWQLYREYR
jgi:hypothetical protein